MAGRSSLLGSRLAKDRIFIGDVSGPLGLSLFVLGHSFLLGVGLGLSMRWAEVVKFFDPTSLKLKFDRFFKKKKLERDNDNLMNNNHNLKNKTSQKN